jgi:sugar lactone lactonase YvrE
VGNRHRRKLGIAAGMLAVALYAAIVLAIGTTSDAVLGQLGFTHNVPNLVDGKGLNFPQSVAIDSSATPNRVYVADEDNNRVLAWSNADSFANGAPADLVIGQPDFLSSSCNATSAASLCKPTGVAVDPSGNLYVADGGNSRVLEYPNPFTACSGVFPCVGGPADLVFGQGGSVTSNTCDSDTEDSGSTSIDLCSPIGVAVDASGNLYVADSGNNRVLEYNTPLTAGVTASTVFGQGGSFTSNSCDFDTIDGSSTAVDLCGPSGVALDASDNLYVADPGNNRVLEYNTPLKTGVTAEMVFGQGGSVTSNSCDFDTIDGSSTAIDLCTPTGVAVDASENLYVADQGNGRVLEYNTALTNATADTVFGQGGIFTTDSQCNYDSDISGVSSANDLCDPAGVAVDPLGNLYVADKGNNRVLEYNTPLTSGTTAARVSGQDDFTHNAANLVDAQGLNLPDALAIDSSFTPNRVYVADEDNNRVLAWSDASAFTNGAPANLVIGQPDFLSYLCNAGSATASANGLCDPQGVAVDTLGNLYVADVFNNRVLEYANPFTACNNTFPCVGGPANLVLGQGASFSSNSCDYDTGDGNVFSGASAIDLCYPAGVAVDGVGNLYVADTNNNRVLEYNAPLSTGATAAMVFGQGRSSTSNACNFDGGTGLPTLRPSSAIDLCDPTGVGLDGAGNLYVADQGNNRVLEYNTPLNPSSGEPGAGDTTADTVFGQGGSFKSRECNYEATTFPKPSTANDLCEPIGVTVDASGNVYVADENNTRVLEYNTPLTTGTTAERVYGTCGSFTSSACAGLSANSLDEPKGVAVDASGNLYVADFGNSRVLQYHQPLVTPTPTATATATATQTATATATPTPVPASLEVSPNTLHFPTSVLGSPSKPGKVKLLNPRNSKQDSPILIISAVPTTPFSIDTALSTCHVGTALAPKSDCFFFLTYTASALVTQHGTFTIKDDSETAGRAIVNLDGKGKPAKK